VVERGKGGGGEEGKEGGRAREDVPICQTRAAAGLLEVIVAFLNALLLLGLLVLLCIDPQGLVVCSRCMCIHSTTRTACVSTVLPLVHVYPQYYPYLPLAAPPPA
jgi:hypothetical protein